MSVVLPDEDENAISKVILNGACDYLVTPIQIHSIKFIWKYLVVQRDIEVRNKLKYVTMGENVEPQQTILFSNNAEEISSGKERHSKVLKKLIIRNDEGHEEEASSDLNKIKKTRRLIWTEDLREKFIKAVKELGEESKEF